MPFSLSDYGRSSCSLLLTRVLICQVLTALRQSVSKTKFYTSEIAHHPGHIRGLAAHKMNVCVRVPKAPSFKTHFGSQMDWPNRVLSCAVKGNTGFLVASSHVLSDKVDCILHDRDSMSERICQFLGTKTKEYSRWIWNRIFAYK
jgi:hypothetical protein